MRRRGISYLAFIIVLITLSITIPVILTSGTKYDYFFEEDFEGWVGDADNHVGENDTVIVDWNVTRTTEQAYEGDYSIALEIDGFQDDGGVWLEKYYNLEKKKNVKVTIIFYIYSDNFGMNSRALFLASANITNPEIEEDFDQDVTTVSSDSGLVGWYKFKKTYTLKNTDTIWIAIGFKVNWETFLKFYVDNIRVIISN